MKALPQLMAKRFSVIWYDYAPSLAPEQYVVSVAIDESRPFRVVDLKCVATPHVSNVQKSDIKNDAYYHLIKLWTANFKHYIRGADCTGDIQKMGRRAIGVDCEKLSNKQILKEILRRLEDNAVPGTENYIAHCREAWASERPHSSE
ncbi:MAG: hypothetical protein LBJ84_05490 [Oscillospiraceae bacterium]|jgi:hypothetical protein|nr:hypothetical protein [Oscillospiraceae bacterium]